MERLKCATDRAEEQARGSKPQFRLGLKLFKKFSSIFRLPPRSSLSYYNSMITQFLSGRQSPAGPLLVALILVIPVGAMAAGSQVVNQYDLGSGIQMQVQADGSLRMLRPDTGWLPLQVELLVPEASHWSRFRNTPGEPFWKVVSEGQAGGNRGFSARADDDGDGLVDEDRLDGLDNDNDGKVDEDFQAISDAMAVLYIPGGSGSLYLETYHWAYVHLQQAVFLQVRQDQKGNENPGHLRLITSGPAWHETEIFNRRHASGGRPKTSRGLAYVTFSRDPADKGQKSGTWFGVLFLNQVEYADENLRVARHRLETPLGSEPTQLVICAAPSWLQLNRVLCEAKLVYAGVTDPVSGQRVHWTTPATCARCRLADAPRATWLSGPGPERQIIFKISDGQSGLIDPDLLRLEDGPLGSPVSIAWRPRHGQGGSLAWTEMTVPLLDSPHSHLSDPYGEFSDVLTHAAVGELVFRFPPEIAPRLNPRGPVKIQGSYLDGRPFETLLRPGSISSGCMNGNDLTFSAGAEMSTPEDQTALSVARGQDDLTIDQFLHQNTTGLGLSPDLLKNFPNPFQDVTMIQFRVPRTIGEAFVLQGGELPANIDPAAMVPWGQGPPLVSVKVYSIDGQELVTLHTGYEGPGGQTVQWNGRDTSGRPVASGTYFCKLQIGEWNVTRRLSFLR